MCVGVCQDVKIVFVFVHLSLLCSKDMQILLLTEEDVMAFTFILGFGQS